MQYFMPVMPVAILWLIATAWLAYTYRWFRIGIVFAFVILLPLTLIM